MTLRTGAARVLFGLLVLGYALYAAAFIHQTSTLIESNSFIPDTRRYYVLFDDMMISMRYARNLADGHGLVYNPGGARVEGFTNPLWTGYMALVHLAEDDDARTSLVVQITAALLLIANLGLVWGLAQQVTRSRWAALGAAVFTAFYLPLNSWGLSGTEVCLLTPVITLAAWGTLRALERGRPALWPLALLGASTWVRLDMAVPFAFLGAFVFLADRPHRRHYAIAGPLILAACLAPQFALRRWYYDTWLPNTYYLKMAGVAPLTRISRGLGVTFDFFVTITPLPLLALLARQDRAVRLLAWLFAGQVIYNIWVGGDAWEWYGGANRYVALVMPLVFVLLAAALAALGEWIHAAPPREKRLLTAGLILAAAFLLVSMNAIHGRAALREWTLQDKPLLSKYANQRVQQSYLLEALTTPGAVIAVTEAGVIPYFTPGRTFVDLLGKNDAHIARLDSRVDEVGAFKPGHTKWDYAYSLRAYQPDIVLEWWLEDITPYLGGDYLPVWFPPAGRDVFMRKDSPRVIWERIFGE